MTAQEARELANISKKTIKEIEKGITAMAKDGYNFYSIETRQVNVDEVKPHFEALGYNVQVGENYFRIEW